MGETPAQRSLISSLHRIEYRFAPAVEDSAVQSAFFMHRSDQAATEHRGQVHGHDAGYENFNHDGDGEFMQQPSDDASHEQQRNEDGGYLERHRVNGDGALAWDC